MNTDPTCKWLLRWYKVSPGISITFIKPLGVASTNTSRTNKYETKNNQEMKKLYIYMKRPKYVLLGPPS